MSKSKNDKSAVVKVAEELLDHLQVRFFQIQVDGKICDAFLIRREENFFSYVNECKHLPVPLDLNAGSVLNSSQTSFQCHQHGALYDIETGLCTEGPCKGASLRKLQVRKSGKHLVISAE
jgi:nitrite reductase/ring-hydroxylating ferredoxin subunit